MMVKQDYTVRFVTPAFLGDAEQNGAWRTPPFKALLRQWWRVAVAKDYGYDYIKLREAEGRLFGNAWLEKNFSQSQIRIRLDQWGAGKMKSWTEPAKNITHNEIKFLIDANLYLGYGPLNRNKESKKTTFKEKVNATIQADENAKFTVIYPESSKLMNILHILHLFGTLGGRSRNGWGSFLLENSNLTGFDLLNQKNQLLNGIARPLQNCLQLDWPHAFGRSADGRLLIWRSKKSHKTWQEAMVELAKTKIVFRTSLKFVKPKGHLEQRHILAYPVTNHPVTALGNQARLANQLRFKVTKIDQGYIGVAYHLPCAIPKELQDALSQTDRNWINQQQLTIWQTVHQSLDATMQRI